MLSELRGNPVRSKAGAVGAEGEGEGGRERGREERLVIKNHL